MRPVLVLLLALVFLTVPDAGRAGTLTCQGRPVTIVGDQDAVLVGTPGDDVVMLDGAASLDAGDGDDLVCGGTPRTDFSELTSVDTGPGNDSVVLGQDATVDLGPGADRLTTSAGGWVSTGDDDEVKAGRPPSHDTVVGTASNIDGGPFVRTGVEGYLDDDDVEVTDGAVEVHGIPTGRFVAAPQGRYGSSLLSLESTAGGDWSVDARAGTVTTAGATATIGGFDDYDLSLLEFASLHFVGSAGNDDVDLGSDAESGHPVADLDLGAGDDQLYLQSTLDAQVEGGPGHDLVDVTGFFDKSTQLVHADLGTGRYTVDGAGSGHPSDVEKVGLDYFGRVLAKGSRGGDRLAVEACSGIVAAGSGEDRVRVDSIAGGYYVDCIAPPHGRPAFVVRGGAGDDVLTGSYDDDVLLGGPGTDQADGRHGIDLCRAETRVQCER